MWRERDRLGGPGRLWASAGITHINSNEKLCPQYLLRTDEMDYEIRPIDLKHATILPIGKEGEFKIKKNEMILTMTEGSDQKARSYEVVSMNPANPDSGEAQSSSPSEGMPLEPSHLKGLRSSRADRRRPQNLRGK